MARKRLYDDLYIVVTGASGFIGSCLVRHLNDLGYDNLILVDDFKESSKWKNLVGKKFCDFMSRHELFDWLDVHLDEVESFVHLGADSSTVKTDGDLYYNYNYRYSVKLADLAIENKKRFIYASSAATYGTEGEVFEDDHDKLDSLRPSNRYGFSKHMFDLWLKRNRLLDQVVGLKYFNVYGPNESHKGRMRSMVYNMYHQILETGKVCLFKSSCKHYEDGEQKRDFIYVKDAVKITCDFLSNDVTGIFNVGSGVASSWNELAKCVFEAMDKPTKIEYIDMPEDLVKSYQNYTCADMSKIKAALKEVPHTPLSGGVEDYISYLSSERLW